MKLRGSLATDTTHQLGAGHRSAFYLSWLLLEILICWKACCMSKCRGVKTDRPFETAIQWDEYQYNYIEWPDYYRSIERGTHEHSGVPICTADPLDAWIFSQGTNLLKVAFKCMNKSFLLCVLPYLNLPLKCSSNEVFERLDYNKYISYVILDRGDILEWVNQLSIL